jgi:hypothetical protein
MKSRSQCPLYPPKADIAEQRRHVRFVSKADIGEHELTQSVAIKRRPLVNGNRQSRGLSRFQSHAAARTERIYASVVNTKPRAHRIGPARPGHHD